MSEALDRFVAAGPVQQRVPMRALLAIGRRPRGRAVLRRLGPLEQAVAGMLAMDHYDQPEHSIPLGWDPDAVVARGRERRG